MEEQLERDLENDIDIEACMERLTGHQTHLIAASGEKETGLQHQVVGTVDVDPAGDLGTAEGSGHRCNHCRCYRHLEDHLQDRQHADARNRQP